MSVSRSAAAKRLADLPEQGVAVIVSERVVDLLEAVEIHHQHAARLVAPVRRRERLVHVVTEQGAVRQAGESVV